MTVRVWLVWVAVFAGGVVTGVGGVLLVQEAGDTVPRRWEATIYLPLNDNHEQPIPTERWRRALDLFVAEFDGATLAAQTDGCWRDAHGTLRREPMQPIIVSFEKKRLNDLRRVLAEAGRLLEQESMYARIEEPRILLLPINPKSSQKEP